uniref:Alpha-carbonic anhydrase domain-containing protein n=1 Tax=Nothoprocta perdicaria TaxID=30464 RepID=A0A8C6ZBM1_NOTPE
AGWLLQHHSWISKSLHLPEHPASSAPSEASGADPAGPSHWKELKATCGGSQQSPIDIERRRLRRDGRLGDILFEGYDQAPPGKWRLTNDGHTGASRRLPRLQPGAWAPALCLHVCLGRRGHPDLANLLGGTEHLRSAPLFPPQLHIVHINVNYRTLAEAKGHPNGLAVLGVLSCSVPGGRKPRLGMPVVMVGLTVLIPAVSVGDSVDLASTFPLSNLLPHAGQLSKYYRYQGSLTTPDCSEVVVWTVFEEPVAVSRAQVTVRDRYPGSASLGRAWHGERLGQGWGWRWGNPPLAEVLLAGGLRMGWYLAQPLPLPFSLSLSSSAKRALH